MHILQNGHSYMYASKAELQCTKKVKGNRTKGKRSNVSSVKVEEALVRRTDIFVLIYN